MNKNKIITNIFSNWTNFIILILISFFVTPIIVHNLGKENYGIWILINSLTGYFTVLDFGVNTAIVCFISKYIALKNEQKANEVFSTSIFFFLIISFVVILTTAIFGIFINDFFKIESLSKTYIYLVFFVVGSDLAFSLLFSVFLGTLSAAQGFLQINIISITVTILKNSILVIMLCNGYKLLTLAIIQLSVNLLKYFIQYVIIHRKYRFLRFKWSSCRKSMFKEIYNYSIYSFIIAIALKILFYTDSIVIGKFIRVSEVSFYAIPAMILEYVEKIIWAISMVFIPVISSQDAVGDGEKNKKLYPLITKYTLVLSLLIVFLLFTVGDDFISLWMGKEFGIRSTWVLRILLIGYIFSLSQLIAQAILKGISKHKFLAYVLIIEAVFNLILSIVLVKPYGIEGVAVGTALPLLIANVCVIPIYTCKVLNIKFIDYFFKSYIGSFILFSLFGVLYFFFPIKVVNYQQFFLYCSSVIVLWILMAFFLVVNKEHRQMLFNVLNKKITLSR